MNPEDVRRFLSRDRDAVTASRADHWARRKEAFGPAEALQAADALRRQVLAVHPDWPTEKDRREDLATHARVAACLRLVVSTRAH